MKKTIAMVVALIMVFALILTGCANSDKAGEKKVKAGFIYIGPAADGGFSTSHDVARKAVETEYGIETIYKELVPEGAEVEDVIDNMVDQGCNVIFACSFGYMDHVEKKAADYPDVNFLHCSGYKSNDTNFANYFGRIYQARFLSGLVAGLATQTNQIGYVAAFPIPEVVRGMNAFALGVKAANANATVEVVWTGDWVDAVKAKEAAKTLISKGCDVIGQHQDATSPQQAAEEEGVFSVGYHCDMIDAAPNANIASAVWNWEPYYKQVIKSLIDGKYENKNYWGGMDEGVVDVVITKNAPNGAQELVDNYKAKLKDATWDVFSGPLYDNEGNIVAAEGEVLSDEAMLSMQWLSDNVIGKISAE